MQQYFIDSSLSLNQIHHFDTEQAHHIQHVLRMKENTIVRLVDQMEQVFLAHIVYLDQVSAQIDEAIESHSESKVAITLYMGLIKGEKWDYLIQKAAELGVSNLVPFTSIRSVVKVKEEKNSNKLKRWNKIALEACEQSKRSHRMLVSEPVSLSNVLANCDLNLVAYEDADRVAHNVATCLNTPINSIGIVIGSEGGFDVSEIENLVEQGFKCVSLGGRILRAETAAINLVSMITYQYDQLGVNDENS